MEEKIKLNSRYNDVSNYLEKLDNGNWVLRSSLDHIRMGLNNDNSIYFIDPPGGPFLTVGSKVGDKTIKEFINKGIVEIVLE